ncbi:hypothetical protein QE152_g7619 [Popillia japonica]|uniref:Uncharacterized protein n=1 Tax=Popillia japonica TaxID=7064 RepID=A0AAW1MAB0_POPJA
MALKGNCRSGKINPYARTLPALAKQRRHDLRVTLGVRARRTKKANERRDRKKEERTQLNFDDATARHVRVSKTGENTTTTPNALWKNKNGEYARKRRRRVSSSEASTKFPKRTKKKFFPMTTTPSF